VAAWGDEKEADYRAYKHQDLAYIASGKRPEKSAEFDARLAAERQAAAERREKAVAVRAQRRATIKATARARSRSGRNKRRRSRLLAVTTKSLVASAAPG